MTEIKITMRQIEAAEPYITIWKVELLAALGKTEIDDTPVTFRQIVETSGLDAALFCLRCLPESEQWRSLLFARSCAAHVSHLWNATTVTLEWLRTGDEKLRVDAVFDSLDVSAVAIDAAIASAAYVPERDWQRGELLRIMSLDYSPEVLILELPKKETK
jgi:hypothetical protein